MNRIIILLVAVVVLIGACAAPLQPDVTSLPTPSTVQAPTSAPTALAPTPASKELREYLRRVQDTCLTAFNQRLEENRVLLASASNRSFEADVLCTGEEGDWQRFDDLWLDQSVASVPPEAQGFHRALMEALTAAEKSAATQAWFCQTYRELGQPAEGMWARLAAEIRAGMRRRNELREMWRGLGGLTLGLEW